MAIKKEEVLKITSKGCKRVWDEMVEEYPVSIILNGQKIITLMCTPSHLEELAVGFLYLKKIIENTDQIEQINIQKNESSSDIYVKVKKPKDEKKLNYFALSEESIRFYEKKDSSVPFKTSIEQVLKNYNMTMDALFEMMQRFSKRSDLFVNTGGVHSIGLYENGEPVLFYDDVSRYNTYNKLFGGTLIHQINPENKMLLTTGRIPSEVMTWIVENGIKCVLSISVPTSGSVQIARKFGVTLMGFVRENRLNLYA
ncbi:MAG: formate dehydrogenase accessory sulfurtransferase FdhD [Eubacterium sp.]